MIKKVDTDNVKLLNKYNSCVTGLKNNICNPFKKGDFTYNAPILIEGKMYNGVWLECGPLEGLVYGEKYDLEVAKANHNIFFDNQHEDGYIPFCFNKVYPNGGTGAIQMVVPIAKTAYEVYLKTNDLNFLKKAYEACVRWDSWLATYRDSRGLNLCELFASYDTGHDNSPRNGVFCKGSLGVCPKNDAKNCHNVGTLPWLAPDLSATLYGGRIALSKMAEVLGDEKKSKYYKELAEKTRTAILTYLYDPETQYFYDLDCTNHFIKIKTDVLSRVLCEHVVDKKLFEEIFNRHIINPSGFWAPYPMPSIALDDPFYNYYKKNNSWGGPSQALTALRASRWFEYYGKFAEFAYMMKKWIEAISNSSQFMQQMDPHTGIFSTGDFYSPNMCVMIDYVELLYGVKYENNIIKWNCRLPENSSKFIYEIEEEGKRISLINNNNKTKLIIDDKIICTVQGVCRIESDINGNILQIIGTELNTQFISLKFNNVSDRLNFELTKNQKIVINKGVVFYD